MEDRDALLYNHDIELVRSAVLNLLGPELSEAEWRETIAGKRPGWSDLASGLAGSLPMMSSERAKCVVVQALKFRWCRRIAAAVFLDEFLAAPAEASVYRWSLGDGLEVFASPEIAGSLKDIARDARFGRDREMVVLALGKLASDPEVIDVLRHLLGDSSVCGHAVAALARLAEPATKTDLQRFVSHPKAWIRKEAERGLRKIDRIMTR